MFDIIVIGGGPAGVTAALRASELGARVALVERGSMGGTCTNDGCAPTRVLARAARLITNHRQYDDFGLMASSPEVDFPALLARTQRTIYQLHEKKQLIAHLEASGVQIYTGVGPASFLDAHTIIAGDGQRFQAEKFVLCAGGRARRMDFPGEELALIHSDIWRLQALPRSLAVVGGAATGCQLATIFRAFGAQVTLLEVAPRILPGEDEHVSLAIEAAFRQRDIEIVANISGVDRIERAGAGLALHYRREGEACVLPAEAVVLSTGWLGNVDSLNLAAAGVLPTPNGRYVQVDEFMQTSAPHVFAAGDITGRVMLVQSAGVQARVAVENAVLGAGRRVEHNIVPHGGFTDPEYASVGPTEALARNERDCVVATVPFADIDRAVIDGRTEGFCKLIVDRESHRLLAAHVVGEQALEIVHVAAAGMAAGMWVEQLAELEIAYPTYTAVLGLAARRIVAELGVMSLAPQWRELGRPYATEWERSDE